MGYLTHSSDSEEYPLHQSAPMWFTSPGVRCHGGTPLASDVLKSFLPSGWR